ncbi:YbgC/FadM family acyl-CoA thioesterase [Saccharibacter sp. 17.LH.SD]|uniref:YbgC/FadM family acyl-CoA thioesterase n=1 Tax=Saccharibacter sp. 17.LH.SD TaxID=2689393 RepID=UPI00136D081E|nr:YbgC/FadM family acyl-CoA thioesterase [Saccharibacter sp. 17.LH.SD]
MGAHQIQFRVYYEDTDAGGIVYHARYLGFAERARAEALRGLGISVGDLAHREGIGFVVRQLTVTYHSPLRLDDILSVETVLLELGGARLKLRQEITNCSQGGRRAVVIDVELVCLKQEGMVPVRIKPHHRELLQSLRPSSSE